MSREPLRPADLVLPVGELAEGPKREGSWVGFLDFRPGDPFEHPCAYWYIDSDGGLREVGAELCPDGLVDRFVVLG